jgi:hypothetical protein
MEQVGKYAFVVGLILALLATFVQDQAWTFWVLALVGLIVGFLNITSEETNTFLIAAIGLILSASALQTIPMVGEFATEMIANVLAFLGSAVLVVAIRAIISTAKD